MRIATISNVWLWMILLLIHTPAIAQSSFDVLVFSKTEAFRHSSIEVGVQAIKTLGQEHDFQVISSEDADIFLSEAMDTLEVIVFLSTTGDILDNAQQEALKDFIHSGRGFVGIHAASDTEHDWEWYGQLVGRHFKDHPKIQEASLAIKDSSHLSTEHLPLTWLRTDEWYNFAIPFPDHLQVLITVDETSYEGGTMGDFHPVSWYHEFENGRSFYTAMGHTEESYEEEAFMHHILGGIHWASRTLDSIPDTESTDSIAAPSDLTAIDSAATRIRLSWQDNSDNEDNFILERDTIIDFDEPDSVLLAADVTEFLDRELLPNTAYFYRVKASNDSVASAYSAVLQVNTLDSIPPPTELTVIDSSATQISLRWKDNSDNEEHFILQRSFTETFPAPDSFLLEKNVTEYVDTELTPDTTYFYRIKAVNERVSSVFSNILSINTLPVATGLSDSDPADTALLFPNPVSDYLHIPASIKKERVNKVEILTLEGQLCKAIQISRSFTLDLRFLAPGNYLLRINEGSSYFRFLKK